MQAQTPRKAEQGQALIEFALTIPILVLLIFGVVDFARAIFALTQVIDGARQGIRYGIVTGLDTGLPQYLDCAGIDAAARNVAGFVDLQNIDVEITYEGPDGLPLVDEDDNPISDCVEGLDVFDVRHGDVLAVHVSGELVPVTPLILLITDSFTFEYTSRRTIVAEGSAFTDQWQTQPGQPTGFDAYLVDNCITATHNVSFRWDVISPVPDRIEIRDSITSRVVAEPDPENSWCNNCATISIDGGSGMYYMVTISGEPPSEMISPSSSDDSVSCPDRPDLGSIYGVVCFDSGANGCGSNDDTISGVPVSLLYAGENGTFGDSDDVDFSTTDSDRQGNYRFSGLEAGLYRLSFDQTDPQLDPYPTLTEPDSNPYDITIGVGEDYEQNVGFDE
ncbi:MAG: pilus assembly protein [Anaerolineae bacterium]|nr:pilus assembly protein [Anaerolineae bacterium]